MTNRRNVHFIGRLPAGWLGTDFWNEWANLEDGLKSADPGRRERFKCALAALQQRDFGLGDMLPILAALERVTPSGNGRKGRPRGTGIDDDEAIVRMQRMVRAGATVAQAAAALATTVKASGTQKSAAKRLERKYRAVF